MLALGLILDALIGEPDELWRRVPHPIVLFGKLTEFIEQKLNQDPFRRARGVLAIVALCVTAAIPAWILSMEIFHGVLEVIALTVLLAHRGLVDYVKAVADGLRVSLEEGRYAVARIVGRDPDTLDEAGVARAAIESAAENFSDAVVAPVFWYLVAGLPGIAVYKMINTADSMIGHRNERYEEFGWAAARLDDLANWIPARLTGFLFCLVGGGKVAMDVMVRDAPRHRSINAGWPEAAMAASLGVALAGPRVYEGKMIDGRFLNAEAREEARPDDIDAAVRITWLAWAVVLAGRSLGCTLWTLSATTQRVPVLVASRPILQQPSQNVAQLRRPRRFGDTRDDAVHLDDCLAFWRIHGCEEDDRHGPLCRACLNFGHQTCPA